MASGLVPKMSMTFFICIPQSSAAKAANVHTRSVVSCHSLSMRRMRASASPPSCEE